MTNDRETKDSDDDVKPGATTPNTVGVFHSNPKHEFHGHEATAEDDHRQCICHGCTKDRMSKVDGKD